MTPDDIVYAQYREAGVLLHRGYTLKQMYGNFDIILDQFLTSTSFWTNSRACLSPTPPGTCRVPCSSLCPC